MCVGDTEDRLVRKMALQNGVYRLKCLRSDGCVYDRGAYVEDRPGYQEWLQSTVEIYSEFIFFLVGETTDVFEPEINYNTYAMVVNGKVWHTYSPDCPPGCDGGIMCSYYPKIVKEL